MADLTFHGSVNTPEMSDRAVVSESSIHGTNVTMNTLFQKNVSQIILQHNSFSAPLVEIPSSMQMQIANTHGDVAVIKNHLESQVHSALHHFQQHNIHLDKS